MNNNFLVRLFKKWIRLKIEIHVNKEKENIIFHEGEIWWASIGQNIGSEQNGKNENFERPILILRKFNEEMLLTAPISRSGKTQKYRYQFQTNGISCVVNLSQIRTISSRRILRPGPRISTKDFCMIKRKLKNII